MNIMEEYCKTNDDNSISFLLELKNHLQNEQRYFEYLHESYDNLSKCCNDTHEHNKNVKYIQDYIDKRRPMYRIVNNIDNSHYIDEINNKLLESCVHEYESDYIETGVESNMMKITYCIHCKMNKP